MMKFPLEMTQFPPLGNFPLLKNPYANDIDLGYMVRVRNTDNKFYV